VGARMFQMASTGPDLDQPINIVAGGSGYLGSRLVTRLLAAGQRAVVLTRRPSSDAPYPQARWGHDDPGPLHDHLIDTAGFNIKNPFGRRPGPKFKPKAGKKHKASRVETR